MTTQAGAFLITPNYSNPNQSVGMKVSLNAQRYDFNTSGSASAAFIFLFGGTNIPPKMSLGGPLKFGPFNYFPSFF